MSLRCHNVRLTRCRGSDQRAPIQLSKTSIESGQRPRERRTTNMIASSEFTTILGTCRHPSPLIKRMRRRASHTHNTTRTVIRQVAVHDGNRPPTQHRAVSTEPSAQSRQHIDAPAMTNHHRSMQTRDLALPWESRHPPHNENLVEHPNAVITTHTTGGTVRGPWTTLTV